MDMSPSSASSAQLPPVSLGTPSALPPAPPRPDFSHRVKVINNYRTLRARLLTAQAGADELKAQLSKKKAKEDMLRDECNLILEQIELYRSRTAAAGAASRVGVTDGSKPPENGDASVSR